MRDVIWNRLFLEQNRVSSAFDMEFVTNVGSMGEPLTTLNVLNVYL
jgi:hypothetical protein